MTAVRLAFIGEGNRPIRLVPRHAHAYPLLIWYTRGQGEMVDDSGRVIAFAPNTVICVPSGTFYLERSARGFISLYIALEHLALPRLEVLSLGDDPRFGLAARLLLEEYRRSGHDQQATLPALSALRQSLSRLLSPKAHSPLASMMLEVIHAHSEDPQFTIARGCRRLGVPLRRVRTVFARELGISPLQYLLGWRIAHAGRLLSDGGFQVQQVAYRSGFSDPYYFARVFHRFTGTTPTRYRETQQL
jgi:AraC-like DNA-binding protein